ncbi:MAG: chemotaxis protein CheW [Desulfobacteraceae bacterium]|nr:chemotaxis protein CheW [Desulfobacteraceae bacterium]
MAVWPENRFDQLLVFTLEGKRYALHLEAVESVVRAVEVTPLPDAPEMVLGIINLQGRIVPVINTRRCFRLQERELRTSDQFIIVSTARRTLVFVTDAVLDVIGFPSGGAVPSGEILPGMERIEGVMILADGMIIITDIDKILSLDDELLLDDQLEKMGCLEAGVGHECREQLP